MDETTQDPTQEFQMPAQPTTQTVFAGPISAADQATLTTLITKVGGTATYGKFTSSNNTAYIPDSTETVIKGASDFLQGIAYNASTGVFTISATGYYEVVGVIGWDNHTGYHEGRIKQNGSVIAYDYFYSDPQSTKVVALLHLTAGDTIAMYGYQASGSSSGTPNNTYLFLTKL